MKKFHNRCNSAAIGILALFVMSGALYSVEDIMILPKVGHRQPPVAFTHRAHANHYGLKCVDCHHTGENTKCSQCHLIRDQAAIINLKGAFHQQCLGCHRKLSGPLGCSRCHKITRQ